MSNVCSSICGGSSKRAKTSSPPYEVCKRHGVAKFGGFTECTYRILYDFEDAFDMPQTEYPGFQLFVTLKEGIVENRKALKSKKGKGLVGFGFPQSLEPGLVQSIHEKWRDRKTLMLESLENVKDDAAKRQDEIEKYADLPGNTPESFPFVFQRADRTFALVHVWTINIDEKFKSRFTIYDENPSLQHFAPQAVDELETAMVKLFGDQARNHKAKFAIAQQQNQFPVYIGYGKELINMLSESQEICDEMLVRQVHPDHIVGEIVTTDWKTQEKTFGTKAFHMDLNTKYALYIKTGGDKMTSVKPLDLFEMESVLGPAVAGFSQQVGQTEAEKQADKLKGAMQRATADNLDELGIEVREAANCEDTSGFEEELQEAREVLNKLTKAADIKKKLLLPTTKKFVVGTSFHLCQGGCRRLPFGKYRTCCTKCTGAGGPHAKDCFGKMEQELLRGCDQGASSQENLARLIAEGHALGVSEQCQAPAFAALAYLNARSGIAEALESRKVDDINAAIEAGRAAGLDEEELEMAKQAISNPSLVSKFTGKINFEFGDLGKRVFGA